MGTLQVALVIPLRGAAGIFGPSGEACVQLAVDEINAGTGVLGQKLRLVLVDGGAEPERVADGLDVTRRTRSLTPWSMAALGEKYLWKSTTSTNECTRPASTICNSTS